MEQEYVNRVETYLKGGLSEEDQIKFEKDLKDDPALQKTYQECALAIEVIDQQAEIELKSKFSQWRQEKKKGKVRKFPVYGIAASIVLLLGVYFIFFQKTQPQTNQHVALEFYNLPQAPDKTMGGAIQENWSLGIEAYGQQLYDQAIEAWVPIKNSSSEVNYFLAHSYFNIQDYNLAIPLFSELSKGTSVYNYPSEWYLILSYLAHDDTISYRPQLDKIISDQEHPFYSQAIKLNDKAKGLKIQ